MPKPRIGIFLAGVLLLALALGFKERLTLAPRVDTAPAAGAFDTQRAYARLARLIGGEQAHGVDSPANDRVRERLIGELRGLGLDPRVTDDFQCQNYPESRTIRCARVRNVIAELGPARGKALLISAHYDSAIAGPGASDAGMGIATMLETARHLRREPLARPVILLFNEGEESGLLGAAAFAEKNPLAGRVDALINMEARGVTGPAIMFETSQPNGSAIRAYAARAPRPVANSMTTDFYALIPNSTDVDVFRPHGWTTLNFAVIGNETRYHSPGDDLAALDKRSLQHMGQQVLASARTLASAAPETGGGQLVYMDVLGRTLVVLPQIAGFVLLGLLIAAFAWLVWKRRAFGRPLLVMLVAVLGGAPLAWLGSSLLAWTRGGEYWRAYPLAQNMAVYAGALLACLVALLWIGARADKTKLRAAYWLLFLLIGLAVTIVAPGAVIYFLAPPLVMLAGLAIAMRLAAVDERTGSLAGALVLLLTFLPILALIEMLLVSGPAWIMAPLGALVMLPVLIELRPSGTDVRRPILLGALGLVLVGWACAAFVPAYSADRQQRFAIEYVWDEGEKAGQWSIYSDGRALPPAFAKLGDWTRGSPAHSSGQRWLATAPALSMAAPTLAVLAESRTEGGRRLRVRIDAKGADLVRLMADNGALIAAGTPGAAKPLGVSEAKDVISCQGRSCDGAVLDLVLAGTGASKFETMGMVLGLPREAADLVAARPAHARPQYSPDARYAVGEVSL